MEIQAHNMHKTTRGIFEPANRNGQDLNGIGFLLVLDVCPEAASFLCLPAFRTGAVAGMTVLLTAIRTCPETAGTNNMKPVITYIEGAFWMEA